MAINKASEYLLKVLDSPEVQLNIQSAMANFSNGDNIGGYIDVLASLIPEIKASKAAGEAAERLVAALSKATGKSVSEIWEMVYKSMAKAIEALPSGLLKFNSEEKAIIHYKTHGKEIMDVLGQSIYTIEDYIKDANYIVENGTFVPELNGYVMLLGGKGKAKFGFVGIDRATGSITTFHIKGIGELIKKAPSLMLSN